MYFHNMQMLIELRVSISLGRSKKHMENGGGQGYDKCKNNVRPEEGGWRNWRSGDDEDQLIEAICC